MHASVSSYVTSIDYKKNREFYIEFTSTIDHAITAANGRTYNMTNKIYSVFFVAIPNSNGVLFFFVFFLNFLREV